MFRVPGSGFRVWEPRTTNAISGRERRTANDEPRTVNANPGREPGTRNPEPGTARFLFPVILLLVANPSAGPDNPVHTFTSSAAAEAVAHLVVRCDRCAWDVAGREGATLALIVDRRAPIHLPIVRSGAAAYDVLLGSVEPGTHTLRIEVDQELTAAALRAPGAVAIEHVAIEQRTASDASYMATSLAPIVYARPNTIGRFTDVPVFTWYEMEPEGPGTRFRYSVIFTNEDGGTPTDRLMATWGRTTDIEYIYSVVVDAGGNILADDFQGPDHVTTAYGGQREGRHPQLWVSTENNMVRDHGETRVRYALAPQFFPLANKSREAVMDANPWLYEVMSRELAREGKIVPGAPAGKDRIPDPRRFVYIEACGEVGTSALAFSVRAGNDWIPSDRGMREYRIVRDGCFRVAVPLPDGAGESDIRSVRAQSFERPPRANEPPPQPTPVRLTRINAVFMLDESYRPRQSLLRWDGSKVIAPGRDWEFALP
jgi:hypothetical protein